MAALHPAPAMLATPDQKTTRQVRDRFYGTCEASPDLARRLPPPHRRNDRFIDFGDSLCHLAYAGSTQTLSSESCRVVLVTELDRCRKNVHEGSLEKLIAERVKNWPNFLVLFEGTPTDETSSIIRKYEGTDQRRYLVPCPHCGRYQELRFFVHREGKYAGRGGLAGIKNDDGEYLTPDEARDQAYYLCENGCRIDSADKADMVRRGIWCPAGQTVDKRGRRRGKPIRSPRKRGYKLNSLYPMKISFGRAAEELVSSHGDPAAWQNFVNNWVGSKFTPQTKTPPWTVLGRRLRGHHARGQVASRAFFVTLGADVQQDCVYWIARAWGEAASSWLVDWGCLHKRIDPSGGTRRDSHLAQLDALITREWPLAGVNPMQQTALPTLRTAIDTGHHPLLVHNFARQYHSDRVLCVAGDSSPTAGQPWSFNVVEKNLRTGKPYPGGMRRWALNTDYFKTDLQDRWTLDRDDSGAWLVPDLPLDALADYLKQVANEGKVPRTDKKGRTQLQWVVLQPGLGNHYWDCEVYARAAAEMVVGTVWTDLAVRFQPPAPPREDDDRSQRFIPRRKGGGRWINR